MKVRKKIDVLAAQVEELLDVLERHPRSPEVEERSARVQDALNTARRAIRRPSLPVRIGRYANSVDRYVTGYPRLGFLTGVMLGGAVAYLASLTRAN